MNLTERQHKANPFSFYAYLRWASPVHLVTLPDGRTGRLVTRYDDVAEVLRNRRFVSEELTHHQRSKTSWRSGFTDPLSRIAAPLDESAHARLGALVRHVVTSGRVEALRDRVTSICRQQLCSLRGRGRVDLIAGYALPVSMMLTADVLGVPARDWPRLVRWLTAMSATHGSPWRALQSMPSRVRCLRYVRKLLQAHTAGRIEDPLSLFAEAGDYGLTDDELIPLTILLLIASFETTVNLIGNGMATLLQYPEQMERLRVEPTRLESAIEELARFTSPVEIAVRYAAQNLSIGDMDIPRGELVLAAIASANRDHRQFPDPDVLDIARHPNHHLSFSVRPYDCLAAPLARLVSRVAIGALLDAAGFMLERAASHLDWRHGLTVRGLETLPVQIVRWSL